MLGQQEWSEIDLVLRQHSARTTDIWDGNDRVAYVMAMTEFLEDANLQELHEYVTHEDTEAAPVGKAPRRQGQFKLFMSHLAVYESFVGEVDDVLTRYGVCSFVAHNSIEPSREWGGCHRCGPLAILLVPARAKA